MFSTSFGLGVSTVLQQGCDSFLLARLAVSGLVVRLPGSSWNFDGDPTGIVMVRR